MQNLCRDSLEATARTKATAKANAGILRWACHGACRACSSWARVLGALFLHRDAEGAHLAVEVGAFEAERFGRAADVAVALVQLLQDVIALVRLAGFLQRGELLAARAGPGPVAGAQRGQVPAFDAQRLGVEDQHALHQV